MQTLRDLETEHNKLKRMYAELADGKTMHLKDVIRKKAVDPAHKRPLLAWLIEQHGWSERRGLCGGWRGSLDSTLSAPSRSG